MRSKSRFYLLTFTYCLSRLVTHTPAPQIRPSAFGAV